MEINFIDSLTWRIATVTYVDESSANAAWNATPDKCLLHKRYAYVRDLYAFFVRSNIGIYWYLLK